YGYGTAECQKIIESVGADALFLHLNPLQEAIQTEGDRNFAGLLNKIRDLSAKLEYPVFIKECGCGISENIARQLLKTDISGIDVSGVGGTSWALIESFRAKNPLQSEIGETFRKWGIPTAESLVNVYNLVKQKKPVLAYGGIRNGIDLAKA